MRLRDTPAVTVGTTYTRGAQQAWRHTNVGGALSVSIFEYDLPFSALPREETRVGFCVFSCSSTLIRPCREHSSHIPLPTWQITASAPFPCDGCERWPQLPSCRSFSRHFRRVTPLRPPPAHSISRSVLPLSACRLNRFVSITVRLRSQPHVTSSIHFRPSALCASASPQFWRTQGGGAAELWRRTSLRAVLTGWHSDDMASRQCRGIRVEYDCQATHQNGTHFITFFTYIP